MCSHTHTDSKVTQHKDPDADTQTHTQAGMCLEKRHMQTHTWMYIHGHGQIYTQKGIHLD